MLWCISHRKQKVLWNICKKVKYYSLSAKLNRNLWKYFLSFYGCIRMSVKCCKTAVDFLQQIYFMRTTLQSVNMNRSHLVSTLTLTRNILKGIKNQGKINNCFCLLIYVCIFKPNF